MEINVYSYQKLVETYPEDKYILILEEKSESGLYTIYRDPKGDPSGKVILTVSPVKLIK